MSISATQPDVSFVVAAYNARDTLVRAIDSALAQVGVTVEVIVVDDCSTDGTRDITEAYSSIDERVRLVAQTVNGGPAAARNAGFTEAKGRWIAVLDSDDTIYPVRMLAMLERAETMNAQIVVDNIDVIPFDAGPPQSMFPRDMLKRRPLMTLADFIGSNVIFQSTFNFGYMKPVFERSFLIEHGLAFDESLRVGRTISCSPPHLPAAAAAPSRPRQGMSITCGRDRFRGCSNSAISMRCWHPTGFSSPAISSTHRRRRRSAAAPAASWKRDRFSPSSMRSKKDPSAVFSRRRSKIRGRSGTCACRLPCACAGWWGPPAYNNNSWDH